VLYQQVQTKGLNQQQGHHGHHSHRFHGDRGCRFILAEVPGHLTTRDLAIDEIPSRHNRTQTNDPHPIEQTMAVASCIAPCQALLQVDVNAGNE
jgi:hypothetical protein